MASIAGAQTATKKDSFSPASTFITLVEYDPTARTMDITFKSGTKARHLFVFPSTYLSFKQSPNHDVYYSRAIKGKMSTIKIVDKSIGQQKSTPLKTVKKEGKLDAGLRKQRAHIERTVGTVARAFTAAAVQ